MPSLQDAEKLYRTIKPRLEETGLFADVVIEPSRIRCDALSSAEPAYYSISAEGNTLFVGLQTPARYLSQSIEADLVFTGDKLEELIHEELVELGYDPKAPVWPVQHFRSEDKLYTFRSPLPVQTTDWATPAHAELAVMALKAYEAAFRPLGDMEEDDE